MENIIQNIKNLFTPTYNVLYAPETSANDQLIQNYKVIGNPRNAAWKSASGKRLFTLPVRNREEKFRSFRADRCLSVTWAIRWNLNKYEQPRHH